MPYDSHDINGPAKGQSTETQGRLMVARFGGRRGENVNGYGVSLGDDEDVLETGWWWFHHLVKILCVKLYTLKR